MRRVPFSVFPAIRCHFHGDDIIHWNAQFLANMFSSPWRRSAQALGLPTRAHKQLIVNTPVRRRLTIPRSGVHCSKSAVPDPWRA